MHGSEASLERVALKPGILQNDGSEAMPHAERMVLKLLQNGWYRSISLFHLDSCTPLVSDPTPMDSRRPVVQKPILMQVTQVTHGLTQATHGSMQVTYGSMLAHGLTQVTHGLKQVHKARR